jgi:hypothetical protein
MVSVHIKAHDQSGRVHPLLADLRPRRTFSFLVSETFYEFLMIRRRLIVCCDGTQNDGINTLKPLTNVARIARCVHDEDERVTADRNDIRVPIQQIVYYKAGVGTGTSKLTNLADSVTGTGMSATGPS